AKKEKQAKPLRATDAVPDQSFSFPAADQETPSIPPISSPTKSAFRPSTEGAPETSSLELTLNLTSLERIDLALLKKITREFPDFTLSRRRLQKWILTEKILLKKKNAL